MSSEFYLQVSTTLMQPITSGRPPLLLQMGSLSPLAFFSPHSNAAYGIIAWNSGGAVSLKLGQITFSLALAAEAWAIRVACLNARNAGISKDIFESDSLKVVTCISSDGRNWEVNTMVEDIELFQWNTNLDFMEFK